jgi:hypothetical protein
MWKAILPPMVLLNRRFCAAEAKFGLVDPLLLRGKGGGGEGGGRLNPNCFLSISFSWFNLRLHTKNQLHMMHGSRVAKTSRSS